MRVVRVEAKSGLAGLPEDRFGEIERSDLKLYDVLFFCNHRRNTFRLI